MKKTILIVCSFLTLVSYGQVTDNDFDRTDLATGLDTPWEILWGPDNKIWFTERRGNVKRLDPQTKQIETLLTIPSTDIVENQETGLLGMALHPDFTTSKPWVYLVYTYPKTSAANGIVEKLVRYTYQNNQLVSPQILLDDIKGNTTHVGSRLLFLADKTLLMTTGEAQDRPLAQDKNSLNGKILRMNEDGSPASGNPVSGSRMYSYGHRNPQGLVYGNGKIYSAEHGDSDNDEINIIEPNKNYGWPSVRGYCDNQNTTETNFCNANQVTVPIWTSGNTSTEAVAGLDYYPSSGAATALQNSLLLVSLKFTSSPQRGRDLRVYKLNSEGTEIQSENILLNNLYGRLRDICVSPAGDIYVSTSNKDGRGTPATDDDKIIRLRHKTITSVEEQQLSSSYDVYPNPVKDILYIGNRETSKVSLVNVNGSSTHIIEVVDGRTDVSKLPSGVYYLTDTNHKVIGKIVKM